ncbi:MAG TPA: hypothetical protein VGJ90_13470 [Methylophilaceae bacterium]|jgi:ABC-type nickel/cobalt efflux system permease component RcnA
MHKLLSVLFVAVFSAVSFSVLAATDTMSAAASAESPSKTAAHKHSCHRHCCCHHHHAKQKVKKDDAKTEVAPAETK